MSICCIYIFIIIIHLRFRPYIYIYAVAQSIKHILSVWELFFGNFECCYGMRARTIRFVVTVVKLTESQYSRGVIYRCRSETAIVSHLVFRNSITNERTRAHNSIVYLCMCASPQRLWLMQFYHIVENFRRKFGRKVLCPAQNWLQNVWYTSYMNKTSIIIKFTIWTSFTTLKFNVGSEMDFCAISNSMLHWALRTPCEFDTDMLSAPLFVNSMYSSSGFIE